MPHSGILFGLPPLFSPTAFGRPACQRAGSDAAHNKTESEAVTAANFGSLDTVRNNCASPCLRPVAVFTPAEAISHSHVSRSNELLAKWKIKERGRAESFRRTLGNAIKEEDRFWKPGHIKMFSSEEVESPGDAYSPKTVLEFDKEAFNKELDSRCGNLDHGDLLKYAKDHFLEYLDHAREQHIVFTHKTTGKHLIAHAQNRYSDSYQKKVKRQLNPLFERNTQSGVFLTLTLDPKHFDTVTDMYAEIGDKFHHFLREVERAAGKKLNYLGVLEAQKTGNPHIHVYFRGILRLLDWRELRDLWGLGHIWINNTTRGGRIRSPAAYMAKYILKTFKKTDRENVTTQSLLYLFHKRSYFYSAGLLTPLSQLTQFSNGEWDLCGMLTGDENACQLGERELSDIISFSCSENVFGEG